MTIAFRHGDCSSQSAFSICIFLILGFAGSPAKADGLNCDPLDTRVNISSETEASAELAASTLLKIGKATGNIKGDAKKTINNYVGSNATEFDRVLYLFCGMVGKATDIPTPKKFEMYLQLLQLQKENSQDKRSSSNDTSRPATRGDVKPSAMPEPSVDELDESHHVSRLKRQSSVVRPATAPGASKESSAIIVTSKAPTSASPAANRGTQLDEGASTQLEGYGDGTMGEAISIGSCVSRDCVHYTAEERRHETNASKDKCKSAKMTWREALTKTASPTTSARLRSKLEPSSAIKCVEANANFQCISTGGIEDILVDAGGGLHTMPSFHCSESDLWSGRLY